MGSSDTKHCQRHIGPRFLKGKHRHEMFTSKSFMMENLQKDDVNDNANQQ